MTPGRSLAAVIDPVWSLLETAYEHCGVVPTLLERDFNIPPLPELLGELDHIAALQDKHDHRHADTIKHNRNA